LAYRKRISEILEKNNIHYLFDIHGMKNTEYDVDIGTGNGKTATSTLANAMIQTLLSFGLDAKKDHKYVGLTNDLLITHSSPPGVQGVQIEISEPNRRIGACLIVEGLCSIICNIVNRWNNL